jgi:hypothetical protein
MHDTAVFLGPTLDLHTARRILDAEYLPPIKRGDLARLDPQIRRVAIVDGEFYQSLAVSPKEVLVLLDRGVAVYGASSMGALRAAETCAYGMVGVGTIFEWYRDGVIDADDEVAVTYDPVTYRSTSVPLVNLRACLRGAVVAGVVPEKEADEVIRILKEMYFPLRSYQLVTKICPALEAYLLQRQLDQKRDDAVMLLQMLSARKRDDPSVMFPIALGAASARLD